MHLVYQGRACMHRSAPILQGEAEHRPRFPPRIILVRCAALRRQHLDCVADPHDPIVQFDGERFRTAHSADSIRREAQAQVIKVRMLSARTRICRWRRSCAGLDGDLEHSQDIVIQLRSLSSVQTRRQSMNSHDRARSRSRACGAHCRQLSPARFEGAARLTVPSPAQSSLSESSFRSIELDTQHSASRGRVD